MTNPCKRTNLINVSRAEISSFGQTRRISPSMQLFEEYQHLVPMVIRDAAYTDVKYVDVRKKSSNPTDRVVGVPIDVDVEAEKFCFQSVPHGLRLIGIQDNAGRVWLKARVYHSQHDGLIKTKKIRLKCVKY